MPPARPATGIAPHHEPSRLHFFIASIRNRHTRRNYGRQAELFLSWCQARGLRDIREVRTEHVAAYIERMSRSELEAASVKQALSALYLLFSWLVVHQVVRENPTASVRGPKLVVAEGKTPYLPPEEVVRLIESIPTDTLVASVTGHSSG
jgi:site-specific recombinase XerD